MIDFKIIRSGRRTLSLEVRSDLSVIVRAPYFVTDEQIISFVESKSEWLEKHKRVMRERLESEAQERTEPPFTEEQIRELAQRALSVIPSRAASLAEQIGVTYTRITIRNQLTRWGSCSSHGNLNFNCLLMLCPTEVLDYVIIHELCHRKHMNHSPEFWQEVERHCPNYKQYKEYLRHEGTALIKRLK